MEVALEPCSKRSRLDVVEQKDELNGKDISCIVPCQNESSAVTQEINTNEEKFGICALINKNKRISGILKQRYSDFMVRECNKDGELVLLTDLKHIDSTLDENKDNTFCPITDNLILEKIEEFVKGEDKTATLTLDADNDKEHRKLVHKYIKDTYKEIETDTAMNEDGSRAIKLSFKSNNKGNQVRRAGWPKNLPKYCHFTLFKENRDTMECINVLAKLVHVKPSRFGYAGTKDRRAVTIQKVSVQNVYSKQLSNLKLKNMSIGNFSYKDTGLFLGDLSGNNFTIIIRDLSECDDTINLCCKSLHEEGFINYFGLQRFGTGEIPTHAIGRVLLLSRFDEAVNMILQHNVDEKNDRFQSSAKMIWQETKDAKKAFSAVRSRTSIEGKILEQLSKQSEPYNYYKAFMDLPRNNRLMYLHSYQSLVWNTMVSKRIKELGFRVCEGDLILTESMDDKGHSVATPITEDDVTKGTYTIYDIVLPLPGYDVTYPTNAIGQYYRDMLSSDGIDIDNMKNKIKDISLPGTYRHMVVKPKDFTWMIKKYDDYKISLIQTDLEKLMLPNADITNEEVLDGKHKALVLQMTLATSCYATSALREVLIADSSFKSQVTLNEKFKEKET